MVEEGCEEYRLTALQPKQYRTVYDPVLRETIAASELDVLVNHATAPMAFLGLPVSISNFPGGEVEPQIELHAAAINILARERGHKDIFKEAQTEKDQTELAEARQRSADNRLFQERTVENVPKTANLLEDELEHHTTFAPDDGRMLNDISKEKCPRCGATISLKILAEGLARRYPYGGEFDDERKKMIKQDLHTSNTLYDIRCTGRQCWATIFHFVRFLEKGHEGD